jgi:hypothetical protein
MSEHISKELLDELLKLTGSKRARVVVEHIATHGFITTEELERDYGYNHPPRAARDVRDAGIPLRTLRVTSSDGRSIAAYEFGDLARLKKARAGGRRNFSKAFKSRLWESAEGKCTICSTTTEQRYLQIDHRVPYEIAGDDDDYEQNIADYMPLCRSCNRAKSWSCEHCPNWHQKSAATCARCYWAYPEEYDHIALIPVRRADVQWEQDEIQDYEKLKDLAGESHLSIPEYIKRLVAKMLRTPMLLLGL